jgi:hypothetical protein
MVFPQALHRSPGLYLRINLAYSFYLSVCEGFWSFIFKLKLTQLSIPNIIWETASRSVETVVG